MFVFIYFYGSNLFVLLTFIAFGEIMAQIGVKEPQIRTGQAFTHFAEAHRDLEKFAIDTLKHLRPVCFHGLLVLLWLRFITK